MVTTRYLPLRRQQRATWLPMYPQAPVTRIVLRVDVLSEVIEPDISETVSRRVEEEREFGVGDEEEREKPSRNRSKAKCGDARGDPDQLRFATEIFDPFSPSSHPPLFSSLPTLLPNSLSLIPRSLSLEPSLALVRQSAAPPAVFSQPPFRFRLVFLPGCSPRSAQPLVGRAITQDREDQLKLALPAPSRVPVNRKDPTLTEPGGLLSIRSLLPSTRKVLQSRPSAASSSPSFDVLLRLNDTAIDKPPAARDDGGLLKPLPRFPPASV